MNRSGRAAIVGAGPDPPPSSAVGGRSGRPWSAGERCPGSPPPPPPFPRACLCSWHAGVRWFRGPVRKKPVGLGRGRPVSRERRAGRWARGCRVPRRPLCHSTEGGWGLRGEADRAAAARAAALSRAVGEVRGTGAREPACWVGEGGLARLRLVARSRHYAGRHFLSDPGEERLGAAWLP